MSGCRGKYIPTVECAADIREEHLSVGYFYYLQHLARFIYRCEYTVIRADKGVVRSFDNDWPPAASNAGINYNKVDSSLREVTV